MGEGLMGQTVTGEIMVHVRFPRRGTRGRTLQGDRKR
jgi:hypothetical protein